MRLIYTLTFAKIATAWQLTAPHNYRHRRHGRPLHVGDAQGEYYGESAGSFMVREFNSYEQLEEIVSLAAQSMPQRPDGIVTVAKFTSASDDGCRSTEAEYERCARRNPASLFLRCFKEYENSGILFGQAQVTVLPTFDLFYLGNRVARIEGSNLVELEELLKNYQLQNSSLDLFSENSLQPWGDGKAKDPSRTPRTTARFIVGYDWNKNKGFFDDLADKAQSDFEAQFGGWLPNVEDE
ncbi:hypothetical protein MPSEU_000452300 [Mayamaea pseudoterrestris]|nr:hypothetical protein MPSEU_000452300 [Mayamaea pseudoterrestris]